MKLKLQQLDLPQARLIYLQCKQYVTVDNTAHILAYFIFLLSKVASVENDASGGSDSETAVPVPSLSKFFLPCSNLEAVNGTLQSEDVLDSASDNRPLNCTSLTQMPGKFF